MESDEPLPGAGVKVANSFSDLAKKIGWNIRDIHDKYDITLQEFLQPLFEKEYLQLYDHSIILTNEGFIMSIHVDQEKISPEVKR